MALRTVILETLVQKEMERSQGACSKDILTKHLVEFSVLARTFKNTQVKSLYLCYLTSWAFFITQIPEGIMM